MCLQLAFRYVTKTKGTMISTATFNSRRAEIIRALLGPDASVEGNPGPVVNEISDLVAAHEKLALQIGNLEASPELQEWTPAESAERLIANLECPGTFPFAEVAAREAMAADIERGLPELRRRLGILDQQLEAFCAEHPAVRHLIEQRP